MGEEFKVDSAGRLTLVSLPIGNTEDLTTRSLRTLKEVDYILAEDTRQIIKLAKILETTFPEIKSYRDQTHDRVVAGIISDLAEGKQIALVADRGTPTISDPGYKLVKDVAEAGFSITATPGPTAAMMALSISGLPTDRFSFLGFLPRTAGKQQRLLAEFGALPSTLIMYESPFRVSKLVENIRIALGDDVPVVACSELTKLHEKVLRGSAAQLAPALLALHKQQKLKGEWVVLCRT